MKRSMTFISCFLSILLFFCSVGGVFATWVFAGEEPVITENHVEVGMGEFLYVPDDMPTVEVTALQRLSDILNNKYKIENVVSSRDYLLDKTIQVFWGGNIYADPYVGSMDVTFAPQIELLFQDVLFETGVSFILKHQDLNGDGYREVAMYSTSDPLTCQQEYDGIVCVFVSVFTPFINEYNKVVGYTLVCESLRGYCYEVFYDYTNMTPSFSTDTWLDDVGYNYYGVTYSLPEPERHTYELYNKVYWPEQWWSSRTFPYGNNLGQCLYNKIPYLG